MGCRAPSSRRAAPGHRRVRRARRAGAALPGVRRGPRAWTLGVLGESAFGPNLQAALVALTVRNRVSRRDLSELAGELFGVRVSVGAIDEICQRACALLTGPHERLVAGVLGSGAINVDETGWYLAGENRSMWAAATANAAIFRIVAADRHRDRLIELLGPDFQGIVTSDRWWAYDHLDPRATTGMLVTSTARLLRFHSRRTAPPKRVRPRPASSSHRAECSMPGIGIRRTLRDREPSGSLKEE